MTPWLLALPPLIAGGYAAWQYRNLNRFQRATRLPAPPGGITPPSIAVLVPFRNEAGNLPALLQSLYRQQYAGFFEIILIDDFSTDGGGADRVPPGISLRTLRLEDFPHYLNPVAHKKSALTLGVALTDCDVIVTTDADCVWPPAGLQRLGETFAAGADVVLGPVMIDPVTDVCSGFQALDLASYQLFTQATAVGGAPALANGAHFAFRKNAFAAVGGYRGVDHLASGDDVLLLHKFIASGRQEIRYLGKPDAIVATKPVDGWSALWRQRVRWAGKAGHYANAELRAAQALAFLNSLGIVAGLLLSLYDVRFLGAALLAWAFKAGVDYLLLREVCRFYMHGHLLRWYPAAQFVYPFYLVAVGTAALLGVRTDWKGRR